MESAIQERMVQMEAIKRIRAKNDLYSQKTGRTKTYYNLVMGCQMNVRDGEKLAGMLSDMGYVETSEETDADFIIYNTCCVRENAEQKVYGKLGFLKHHKIKHPDALIAVCGCMMQQESVIRSIKKSYRHVDVIFGTFNLYKLPQLIETRLATAAMVCDIWKESKEDIEDLPSIRKLPFKASVNIMYGCDNFCSYCIVPYVRGRERSREAADILSEIKALLADGVKEITLLGQNVNSYGKNLENPMSFAALLLEIDKIPGLLRLHFMTSHPKDISDELIEAMGKCQRLANYLHLPFQSGSTRILKSMNRKYSKEQYLEIVEKVRRTCPDIHISTDIIVGFPGETEEDFLDTLDVVEKVRFAAAYTFLYSKRTGTPGATMEGQVEASVAKERFGRLLGILNPIAFDINKSQIAKTLHVLVEGTSKHDDGYLSGRGENNSLVHFPGDNSLIGEIVTVKIIANKTFYLIGEGI